MQIGLFLENKIKKQLDMNGCKITFTKIGTDKYNQPNKVLGEYEVLGLYHVSVSYVKSTGEISSKTRNKPEPMLLLLKEDADKVELGHTAVISNKKYKVIDKHNIQNFDVAYDISLEVIN